MFLGRIIQPRVVYPLNSFYKNKEERGRSKPAKVRGVRFFRSSRSATFLGKRYSYVELPNYRGRLRTGKSITLMAVVRHYGRAGPILNYNPRRKGVGLWMVSPSKLLLRFSRRHPSVFAYMRPRQKHLVAAVYDYKYGLVKLFIDRRFVKVKYIGRTRLATNYPARIGALQGGRRYFRGEISCIQIYGVPLKARQILRNGNACGRRRM